ALSPDGTRLVYVVETDDTTQLHMRSMDELESHPIAGTRGGFDPFFSPDGQWVGFFTMTGKLRKISLLGGTPVTLCDARNPHGGSWGSDGDIVFTTREGDTLRRVSARGGSSQVIAINDGRGQMRWPQILPGNKAVLTGGPWVVSIETGERRRVHEQSSFARYVPTGHLVYTKAGVVFAVPFDVERLEATGEPAPVLRGVEMHDAPQATFSLDGTLAYVPGTSAGVRSLVWVDRQGSELPLDQPARRFGTFEISPDGRKVAIDVFENGRDTWILDLARGTWTRLTFNGASGRPLWTPDGDHVVLKSTDDGQHRLLRMRVDGSGEPQELYRSDVGLSAYSVSPDGQLITMTEKGGPLMLLPLTGGSPEILLDTPFDDWGAVFSPDGEWIAYTSDESGRFEIYVRSVSGSDRRWQLSHDGGEEPIWSRLGDELFYRNGIQWMVVAVDTEAGIVAETPRVLIEGHYVNVGGRSYAVAADAQRFLMLKTDTLHTAPTQINVVLNWFEELQQIVPLKSP
ncbi:MAG: hypothetical protein V3T48_02005, partial [Vicinamibacterales bacterium]